MILCSIRGVSLLPLMSLKFAEVFNVRHVIYILSRDFLLLMPQRYTAISKATFSLHLKLDSFKTPTSMVFFTWGSFEAPSPASSAPKQSHKVAPWWIKYNSSGGELRYAGQRLNIGLSFFYSRDPSLRLGRKDDSLKDATCVASAGESRTHGSLENYKAPSCMLSLVLCVHRIICLVFLI